MNFNVLNPTMDKLLKSFKLDISYIRAEGLNLYDLEGTKYLDFISQYGAVPFGYNPPDIINAAKEFFDSNLPTLIQPSIPVKAVELAERLIELTPGNMAQATFCQSGAEAVEIAIKMARSTTGKHKIISAENSFHGKTMGALSATGRKVYQEPFSMPVPGFEYIPFNNLSALEEKLIWEHDEIAAFMVEPIQGEGGIIVPSEGYLKEVERLCRHYGVLLIADEIQTGLGRSGYLFACDKEGISPDIILLSKALGGGLVPLGVCLSSKKAWNDEFGHLHSSTFANNNFTCSIGLAVLEKLLYSDGELINSVFEKGNYLRTGLKAIDKKYPGVIKEIRGQGLMVGVDFNGFDGSESFSMKYLAEQGGFSALLAGYLLRNNNIRCAPFLNNPMTLRLQPSLTVSKDEINTALEALQEVVELLYYQDYSEIYGYILGRQRAKKVTDFRSYKKPIQGCEGVFGDKEKEKFAFLIHYPAADDVVKNNPSFKKMSSDELEKFLDWEASLEAKPEVVVHLPAVQSKAGKVAEGWLIGVPYSGKHFTEMPRKKAVEILKDAVDLAKDLGAKMVGLGAYTSVVSRGGKDLQNRGIAITSGNSYTIITAFEALLEGANMMGIDKSMANGSIIGATGSIGRVCAIMLADEVRHLYLVGNPAKEKTSKRRLERLADEIYKQAFEKIMHSKNQVTCLTGVAKWLKGFLNYLKKTRPDIMGVIKSELENDESFSLNSFINEHLSSKGKFSSAPIKVTVNINQALMLSEMVIAASNSTSHLIGPGQLKSGCVVCDVARPADVSKAVIENRKDVLVIEGGLVKYPSEICFGQNMGYDAGTNLACLSETMLMALEGDYRDISIGVKISMDDVHHLKELAKKHGFELAMPRNVNGEVSPHIVKMAKEAVIDANKVVAKT